LSGFDYSSEGVYFVTICVQDRACIFGSIQNGEMFMRREGQIARQCWLDIPRHFDHVHTDEFQIMPNHLHGILILGDVDTIRDFDGVGAQHAVPLQANTTELFGRPVSGSLATIIRSYKSAVTKLIRRDRNNPNDIVWQRNYYESIVRTKEALGHIRQYIKDNPVNWGKDVENPGL